MGDHERKKYLVVGANSFLAREIISRLKGAHDVSGIYHQHRENLFADVKSFSISEIEKIPDQFHTVFVISAYVPGKDKHPDLQLLNEVNVNLPAKISRQFPSARIIYASSVSVYGEAGGMLIETSRCINPLPYGASKLRGEEAVSSHTRFSIMRISSMYGIGMNRSTFIPRIIEAALKHNKITLFGDGSRVQNYIHVGDVAELFIRASGRESNGVFLAAGDVSYSNKQVALEVKGILRDTDLDFAGGDHSPSYHYSAAQTYRELEYIPKKNFHEGISELIQWQQKEF